MHDLCAEAIDRSLLPSERHAIHAALAELTFDEPAEAAWHWERAARPAQARMAHVAAGEMAEEVEPGETALDHYAAALELTDTELTDADEEADLSLLTSAATAAAAAVAFRRAAAYVEQALRKVAGGRVERLLTTSAGKRDAAVGADAREVAAELSDQLGHYRRGGGDPVGAQRRSRWRLNWRRPERRRFARGHSHRWRRA